MPLYEYHCQGCNANVELLIRSAEEKAKCPKCGFTKLQRLLSVSAAPSIGGKSLPLASPTAGCGRNECASGRCMFSE
jgi:putative FmdB family regulatory protein